MFLQTKLAGMDNGRPPGSLGSGGGGSMSGRLGVTASKMQSFGLLRGSRTSMDLLAITQQDLQRVMTTCEHMTETNQSYPAMLMLEMVADCASARIAHEVAVHGHVQQCHDSILQILPGMDNLPVLWPRYELTFTEFKSQLQAEFQDAVEAEMRHLDTLAPSPGAAAAASEEQLAVLRDFEATFDVVRGKVAQELEDFHLDYDTRAQRIQVLDRAIGRARAVGLDQDADRGAKLVKKLRKVRS